VRRVEAPLHTGLPDPEPVCVYKWSVEVHSIVWERSRLVVVEIVQPFHRGEKIRMRSGLDLGLRPAGCAKDSGFQQMERETERDRNALQLEELLVVRRHT